MNSSISCPGCGKQLAIDSSLQGKKLRCPCGQIFQFQKDRGPSPEPSVPVAIPVAQAVDDPGGFEQAPPAAAFDSSQPTDQTNPADPFALPLEGNAAYAGQMGELLERPKAPPPRAKAPVKKARRGLSWDALTESEKKWIGNGIGLVIFGFLAMILPSFGFTMRRLARAGDFAPLLGVLFALGGTGCIAAGLSRFPGVAAAVGAANSVLAIGVCVVVMLPVFSDGAGQNAQSTDWSFGSSTEKDARRGKSVKQQLEEQKQRNRANTAASNFPANSTGSGWVVPPPVSSPPTINTVPPAPGQLPITLGTVPPLSNNPFSSGSSRDSAPAAPDSPDSIGNRGFGRPPNAFGSSDKSEASVANPLEEYFANDGFGVTEATSDHYELKSALQRSRWIQLTDAANNLARTLNRRFGRFWEDKIPGANLTQPAGRPGGQPAIYVHPDRAPIVGVRLSGREFARALRLEMILPVWDREGEDIDLLARPGYALAGLEVKSDDQSVNGVRLIFMKLSGNQFDAEDRYTSDWLGASRGRQSTKLAGDGRAVFGFALAKDTFVRQIALVCDPD